jgi:thioredoxin reductase (NADPH)
MKGKFMTYDAIIIGGGPGGLTAGIYAARAKLKTLLIRSAFKASLITTTDLIDNFPGFPEGIGGSELIERITQQALRFGLEIIDEDVSTVSPSSVGSSNSWQVNTSSSEYKTLSLIISTGTEYAYLNVPGETEFTGRGVSYCATCDGPFYRDGKLIVVGGGDTAIQEALFLTRFAKSVIILHRRDRLRATAILQEQALSHEKISFEWNAVVEEILGDSAVKAIRIRDALQPDKKKTIEADGVFVFTGNVPNTSIFKELVKMDENEYIIVDSHMKTSIPGIFACGDCTAKLLRQVVTACGDGAVAAFAMNEYINELKGNSYKRLTEV